MGHGPQLAFAVITGFVLARLRRWTGSLHACVEAHALYNLSASYLLPWGERTPTWFGATCLALSL